MKFFIDTADVSEIKHALNSGHLSLHAKIKARFISVNDKNEEFSEITERQDI